MSKTLLAATTAAIIFSGAMLGTRAAAMNPASPAALHLAGVTTFAPTPVAIVCGVGGCTPVSVKRVWHPPRGFPMRAAPLNMPGSNPQPQQPENASANNSK